MGRECVICGKPVYGNHICRTCFRRWCCDSNGSKIMIPEWVKELSKIQRRFDRQLCNSEIPMSEFGENDLIVSFSSEVLND